MKFQYLLLLGVLLVIDILSFTEIAALVRQPSDTAVAIGLLLLGVLIIINFIVIKYSLSKFKA